MWPGEGTISSRDAAMSALSLCERTGAVSRSRPPQRMSVGTRSRHARASRSIALAAAVSWRMVSHRHSHISSRLTRMACQEANGPNRTFFAAHSTRTRRNGSGTQRRNRPAPSPGAASRRRRRARVPSPPSGGSRRALGQRRLPGNGPPRTQARSRGPPGAGAHSRAMDEEERLGGPRTVDGQVGDPVASGSEGTADNQCSGVR
jgi:hypothetical protein